MAVQLTILRRRQKGADAWRIGPDTALPKRLYPYASLKTTPKEVAAAMLVQRHFRGWRTRKYTDRLYRERSIISEQGFRDVIAMVARTNKGWIRFCGHVVLMGLMYGVVFFLLFQSSPSTAEQEQSILKQYLSVETDGGDFQSVTDIQSMKQFFLSAVEALSKPDPNFQFVNSDTDFCAAFDSDACLAPDGAYFEDYTLRCAQVTNGSGFFTPQNRVQLGMFVTQTRRAVIPCTTPDLSPQRFNLGEEYTGDFANELPCVSETLEQNLGEWVGEAPLDLENNPVQRLNSAFESFQVVLNLGLFNYDTGYNTCRLQRLLDLGWVDQFTKEICTVILVYNANGDGLFGLLEQCYSISTSGLVRGAVTNLGSVSVEVGVGQSYYETTAFVVFVLYSCAVGIGAILFLRLVLKQLRCCGLKRVKRKGVTSVVLAATVTAAHILAVVIESVSYVLIGSLQEDVKRGALDALPKVAQVVVYQKVLEQVFTFIFVIMLLQAIILLDFLYDTGFISRTIYQASADLTSFLFVFILITTGYAYVGNLLYGSYGTVGFDGMWNSIFTLIFAAFGDFERVFDSVFNEVVAQQEVMGPIFLWSYVVLTTLIMFNILLSIIVEAFISIQEAKRREGDIPFMMSLMLLFQIHHYNFRHWLVPMLCCRTGLRGVTNEVINDKLVFWDDLRYPGAKNEYLAFLRKRHTFRMRLYFMQGICKQNIEQFTLRKELTEMVSDSLCSKLLYLCRFRTAESGRSYEEVGYNTIEQVHNLPLQTLQKLQLVLERIEQSTDPTKRKMADCDADKESRESGGHHSCQAVEEKLDKLIEQMNTLVAVNATQTNGQSSTEESTEPVIVRVSSTGSYMEE